MEGRRKRRKLSPNERLAKIKSNNLWPRVAPPSSLFGDKYPQPGPHLPCSVERKTEGILAKKTLVPIWLRLFLIVALDKPPFYRNRVEATVVSFVTWGYWEGEGKLN